MKLYRLQTAADPTLSPSMRREWIEIRIGDIVTVRDYVSPSMRREWIEILNFCIPATT